MSLFDIFKNRYQQGHRTIAFPKGEVSLPARFRGLPALEPNRCPRGCRECAEACPTGAISTHPLRLDLGKCLFCPACADACPEGAIRFTTDHRLAVNRREDLRLGEDGLLRRAEALGKRLRALYGRSLALRQVSAGGCNACEADLNVLGINVFDLPRFGITFTASPRHADGLVLTGPVTPNMEEALRITWEAIPEPRIAIAVGACAISGGSFAGANGAQAGAPPWLPVDLYIPGCPPHPLTLLDGLLRLVGRLEERRGGGEDAR